MTSGAGGILPGMGEQQDGLKCRWEVQVHVRPEGDRYPAHYAEFGFPNAPRIEYVKTSIAEVRDQWYQLYGDSHPMVDQLDVASSIVRVTR